MSWQELVLTVGALGFAVALVPTMVTKEKPNLMTSLGSTVLLAGYAVAYGFLHLYWAALTTSVLAGGWLVLAVQSWRRGRSLMSNHEEEPGTMSDEEPVYEHYLRHRPHARVFGILEGIAGARFPIGTATCSCDDLECRLPHDDLDVDTSGVGGV